MASPLFAATCGSLRNQLAACGRSCLTVVARDLSWRPGEENKVLIGNTCDFSHKFGMTHISVALLVLLPASGSTGSCPALGPESHRASPSGLAWCTPGWGHRPGFGWA